MRYITFVDWDMCMNTYKIPDDEIFTSDEDFKKYWNDYLSDGTYEGDFEDYLQENHNVLIERIDITTIF